jgi:site-specific DNA recombinase
VKTASEIRLIFSHYGITINFIENRPKQQVSLKSEVIPKLHIYVRVSTVAQESATSIETQQELGIAKAKSLDCEHQVWNEGGQSSSGDDLSNRPMLISLLEEIDKGNVSRLFVFNTDRLSRNSETWNFIRLKLVKNNVTLYTHSGNFNLDRPLDELMLTFMSGFSQYDNKLRAERSRLGKIKKARQGGWLGGPPPYGYSIEERKLVENKDESKWVNYIFQAYSENKTPREIRQHLLKHGVKTRRGNLVWSIGSIEALLTNTHYGGFHYVTDSKTKESFRIECPQLVPSALVLAVQEAKKRRTRQTRVSESNQKNFYLLKEFMRCSQCGSRYSGRIFEQQYRAVYYCPKMERNYASTKDEEHKKCENRRYLKIEETDKLVWETVVEVLSKSHLFKEEIKKQVKGEDDGSELLSRSEQIKELKKKNKQIQKDVDDITKSLINLETDNILKRRNENELKAIIENVESERTRLLSIKEQHTLQIHTLETKSKWLDWVSKFGEKIEKMQDFSEAEKQMFLRGVLEKITVSTLDKQAHELIVRFKIPYVNDTFEWKNTRARGQGYILGDGEKEVSVDIDTLKKTPKLKD